MERKDGDDLVTHLVSRLRQRILSWSYSDRTRLAEDDLCREYGTSRSPVREALRILEAGGLVDKVPYRGYVVKQMDEQTVWEFYDIRIAVETHVVGRLAERGTTAEWVRRMREMWEPGQTATPNDPERLALRDQTFHEALAEEFGNLTLLNYLKDINTRIQVFRTVDFENEGKTEISRGQHLRIVDAIASGDPEAARQAMVENIRHAQANIREGIKEALARAFFHSSGRET